MWGYVRPYAPLALLAAACMVGEVSMDLVQPSIMSAIVDDGVLGASTGGVPDFSVIWTLGLAMVGLVLFGGLCGSLNNVFVHKSAQNIGNDIRKDCFARVMTLSFEQVDRFGTGSLVTRVTNDITQVQNLVSTFVRGLIRTSMLTFGSLACMFMLNRTFGLITLAALPLIVGCLVACMLRAGPLFDRLQAQLDHINAIMQEDVSGIRVIKACVREAYEKVRFGRANDDLVGTQLHVLSIFALMNPTVNALMYVVVTLVLLAGSYEVSATTTPGAVMAALTYTTQMLNGILMLAMLIQNISRGVASWRRVREVLESVPALTDGPYRGGPTPESGPRGLVELRDVCFSYPGARRPVLDHVSLAVQPGETLAVMGATGCGKTTLASLLPRFYDATSGSVLVDGVDVREWDLKALRARVGVAPQRSELFSTTVAENISWGAPGAGEKDVVAAARVAQADGFVSALPEGYDTVVAERGASLSGGQRQRVAVARAVLAATEVLVLDDATSALDLSTEAALMDALDRERHGLTKIVIAQRAATVRRADRICVLEDGRVAGCGPHEELMRTCEAYRKIVASQLGEGQSHGGA